MKIVDRIVTCLLSFAVLPVAFFTPLIHWIYKISGYQLINGIASLLGGSTISDASDTGLTQDDISLNYLYQTLKDFGVDFKEMFKSGGEIHITVEPYIIYVKMAVVFFIAALLIALAIGIVSIFSNAKKTQMIMSGVGIVSLIGMNVSFGKFAAGLVDGKFTLGALLDADLLSYVTDVQTLNLSSAWVFMIMLFVGVILWNLSVILTSDKEIKPNNKKAKR